ncbi:178eafee-07e5-416a-bc35-0075d4311735 [Sclerotinia trifoliorum]|uniref:178eafee-07e5-416a-bc35-0075d4311735 n=1 Tax=Sclerotinia trifoliorum TaxID=28548 RepID=A0A8H2VYK0_9HELO|nr:178eafee-07e5-416a-bc35-0075d4311735 [Sclerotinia trifoliorum]
MDYSGDSTLGKRSSQQSVDTAPLNVETLYKIDAAMAIAQAELGNTIISCRKVLDERETADMTDSQKEVLNETVKLIDSAPAVVSPGRLSELDSELPSQDNRLLSAKSTKDLLHKSQRYLSLKQELSGLRTWWATAIVKYKKELNKCSQASKEIDQRLKEIDVLEKAAGRIRTDAERTAEAEARVLIRRVDRMKRDLFNVLENFTATRKYMSSVQTQFKAIRDTMREIEGRVQDPSPYDPSKRPIDFNYDYHLPEKRAVDTQWWISKGFSWWANLAYSHLIHTSTNLEDAIHKCKSRQANHTNEITKLLKQRQELSEIRDEEMEFVEGFDSHKRVFDDVRLRNQYFHSKREIATAEDQLAEIRGRLSAYDLNLAKANFNEFIQKLMLSTHTAVRNILGHALADLQIQTGIYNELSLEYVHAVVCLARKSMRAAVDIMTDIDSDVFTAENLDYLEGVSHKQGDDKKDRENRRDIRKLHGAGIAFRTIRQRNDALEDALNASLSEHEKILWLAKTTNGLRTERRPVPEKHRPRQNKGSVRKRKPTKSILHPEAGIRTKDFSPRYTSSVSSHDRRKNRLSVEISQMLADFFRSPDISHHFRSDGWVFDLSDLFRLAELALKDPPTEDEFVHFLEYCNDIEELFETSFRTQKIRKRKVGWELLDEAQRGGPERAESVWNFPSGFHDATDFLVANGSDIYSDTNRDVSIDAFRARYNHLAAYQVSEERFQSYVDIWHDGGMFIVILREESNTLLLRFIDNGWDHLKDFPNIILPYPPITFEPSFWTEIWNLMMEPQVASIWKAKVRTGRIRTVTEFYVEVREAIEKVGEVVGTGYWEVWIPNFIKGRKIQLTLYKFWLFLRKMANVPGPIIVLDRKGQKIHGNRLGDDEVTNRLTTQWGL